MVQILLMMGMSPELHHVAGRDAFQLWFLSSRYFSPQVIVCVQDLLFQIGIESLLQDLAT